MCVHACVCVEYVFLIHYHCSTGVIFPQQWRSGSSGCLNSVLFSLPVHPMQLYTYVNERMISFSWKKYTDRLDFQHDFHCFCMAWVFKWVEMDGLLHLARVALFPSHVCVYVCVCLYVYVCVCVCAFQVG